MYLASLLLTSLLVVQAYAQCTPLPSPLPAFDDLSVMTTLPDPFTFYNGTPLASTDDWACRQQEIKTLVQEYFYGYYPDTSNETVTATVAQGWQGQTLAITITSGAKTVSFNATLTLPAGASASAPVPALITLGGFGPTADGAAAIAFDAAPIAYDGSQKTGAFWELYEGDIGVLTAWAWGFHKIIDALEVAVPEVDVARVGVAGCSRYGKAALAAGFFDERIALTIPLSSGFMGMAPFRFQYEANGANEQISDLDDTSGSWGNDVLLTFKADVMRLPIESTFLTAGVAPRALIWDEGTTDYWTNPEGTAAVTFPATLALYDWLGAGDQVGVSLRNSGHCDPSGNANVAPFINRVFYGTETTRNYHDISPFTAHTETFPWSAPSE
ncbi:carbohydrate esterase family 15 protein [Schizophyllum amplum]|uniref:(4-O-methyl)-D-glucuronate--lignin esterase n=1 Tax=Schizophyllum amplum TaxID=97359 RepID=A0A550C2Q6_9AGAR|nr:carbohydrate esterase family 15 protein [Auriculariopsis ampla]